MPEFVAVDPTTGATLREVPDHTEHEVERRLALAEACARSWRAQPLEVRTAFFKRLAGVLRARSERFAVLMAQEMGKPVRQGRSEVEKCAWTCEWYAEHVADFLEPERIASDAERSYVRLDPLGTVLGIMPWNFPLWQVIRFAAPAMLAGNTMLLKHAPGTPSIALDIEAAFQEAGAPAGLLQNLFVSTTVTAAVIADPRVAAVTLTGSSRAGEAVASTAGAHLKKVVLELGGSDPFVVLEDADIDKAADAAVASRTLNSGQSCIAAKRLIVVDAVAEAFTAAVKERLEALVVGDPRLEATDVGPMARADLREELHRQVEQSVANGATCMLGGELPSGEGSFYPVTLLTHVAPGQAAWEEETFGPVAAIRVVSDEAAALEAANDTAYGLGAAVFTEDRARGERLAAQIHAGCVFINSMVKSDPRLPFGGVGRSGFGRELSWHGLRQFVNEKTVWVG